MIHHNLLSFAACFVAIYLIVSTPPCEAAIIVGADFITIDDAGNPSDGLQYLKMPFSDGLTKVAAIANGVAGGFANTRVATPAEFNDLFAAAGITSNFAITAADGFTKGGTEFVSNGVNYDGGVLSSQLGFTSGPLTLFWTVPDGNSSIDSTRDFVQMTPSSVAIFQNGGLPANSSYGWLLVNGNASAVPEPSSVLLLGFASMIGIATYRRKRKKLLQS